MVHRLLVLTARHQVMMGITQARDRKGADLVEKPHTHGGQRNT